MIQWFNIYNLNTFIASGLSSKNLTLGFGTLGQKDVMLTAGNEYGVLYEDEFLALNMNDRNPFQLGSLIVYVDDASDIWLGIISAD